MQKHGSPRKPQVSSGGHLSVLGEGVWPGGGLGQDWGGAVERGSARPAGESGLYLEGLGTFGMFKQVEDVIRFG